MPPTAITISARCLDRLNECCRKMGGPKLGFIYCYHFSITNYRKTK